MSLLERRPEILLTDRQLLSPKETAARSEFRHLFHGVVGSTVEIMGLRAAMRPFYRSEQRVHYTEPFVPYQRATYAELVEFDSALTVRCLFAQMNRPQLYSSDLWINYNDSNRFDLPETVIDFLGEMSEGRRVSDRDKIVINIASDADELVRAHNAREFSRLRYESQLPIENFAASL